MSVVNGKHVILRADVEQYKDVAFFDSIKNIAESSKRDPKEVIDIFKSGEDVELNQLVEKMTNDFLDLMVVELNNLIEESE